MKKIKDHEKKEQLARLKRAMKDFHKLNEEIAPFIRKKKYAHESTAGNWRESSSYLLE